MDRVTFLPAEWLLRYSCSLGICYSKNSLYKWEWFSFPQQFWGETGQLGDTRRCTCLPCDAVSRYAAFGCTSLLVSETLPPTEFHFWGAEVKQEQTLELLSEGGCWWLAVFAQGFSQLVSSQHIVHIAERDGTCGHPECCPAQNCTSGGLILSAQREAVPGHPVETRSWSASSKPFCLPCSPWRTSVIYGNVFSKDFSWKTWQ